MECLPGGAPVFHPWRLHSARGFAAGSRVVGPQCLAKLFAWWGLVCGIAAAADETVPLSGDPPAAFSARDFSWGTIDTDGRTEPLFAAPVEEIPLWEQLPWWNPQRNAELPRHVGLGEPLEGTSWLNRPWHVGWLVGGLYGGDLSRGVAHQHQDLIGGYRVGRDFDHYWGAELRFAFSNMDYTDVAKPDSSRTALNRFADVNLLYYPWGDSRWRPFASLGMGWSHFDYTLADGTQVSKELLAIPWGGGLKYFWKRWLALRFTVTDNWSIGQGTLDTMHNVAVTADMEVHLGGRRTSYYPYHGSIHLW